MANFELAIPSVLEHEGGARYTDDPADPGGATKWGVSLRFLKSIGEAGDIDHDGDIDHNDVVALSQTGAEQLYRVYFWNKLVLDLVASQPIANKLFDTSVNVGYRRVIKWTQAELNRIVGRPMLVVDGSLGPATLRALNSLDSGEQGSFLPAFRVVQRDYYLGLIALNGKLAKYRNGWLRRAAWTSTPLESGWT